MDTKVDIFFELLRAVYGAARYEAQWPDQTHEQAAKTLWKERIGRFSEGELKSAIDNAQRMSMNGEKEWQWPNIGLILSGAGRFNATAHRLLLSGRERGPEEKERLRLVALANVNRLKSLLDEDRPGEGELCPF
jgi:hypothetical protein